MQGVDCRCVIFERLGRLRRCEDGSTVCAGEGLGVVCFNVCAGVGSCETGKEFLLESSMKVWEDLLLLNPQCRYMQCTTCNVLLLVTVYCERFVTRY